MREYHTFGCCFLSSISASNDENTEWETRNCLKSTWKAGSLAGVAIAATLFAMGREYVSFGGHVDLRKTENGDLQILLNATGRRELELIEKVRERLGIDAALVELLEDHLCNGWELVRPEEIGALTSALLLSDEVDRDEVGEIRAVGRVYWNPDYAVCDEVEQLREKHAVLFRGVGSEGEHM